MTFQIGDLVEFRDNPQTRERSKGTVIGVTEDDVTVQTSSGGQSTVAHNLCEYAPPDTFDRGA